MQEFILKQYDPHNPWVKILPEEEEEFIFDGVHIADITRIFCGKCYSEKYFQNAMTVPMRHTLPHKYHPTNLIVSTY